jgi:hypothetical protein
MLYRNRIIERQEKKVNQQIKLLYALSQKIFLEHRILSGKAY